MISAESQLTQPEILQISGEIYETSKKKRRYHEKVKIKSSFSYILFLP